VGGPIDAIAQDDGALYFTVSDYSVGGSSWLESVAKDGASPPVKLTALDPPGALGVAVDGTTVYWTSLTGGTVWRVAKQGGAAEQLAGGQARPWGIAVAGNALYWANQGSDNGSADGSIVMLDLETKALTTLVSGLADAPSWIAADADAAYWSDDAFYSAPPAIHRIARSGGTPVTLASGDVGPITLAGGQIFWASWNGGMLWSVPASGGTQTLWATGIAGNGPNSAIAAAPDGSAVYWADVASGAVSFADAPGGTPQALSGAVPLPDQPLTNRASFMLLDATRVYLVQYQGSYSSMQQSLILPIAR
jgi:hypothetical protein